MHLLSSVARRRAIALLAAIVGLGASAYLFVEYTTGQPGICLTGSGCDLVRASAFAYPLGIPLPAFGLVFYLVAGWAVLRTLDERLVLGIGPLPFLIGLAAIGSLASLVLTGIEAFVIGAFCTWCLLQAGASWILLGSSIGLVRAEPDVAAASGGGSHRAQRRAAQHRGEERTALLRTGWIGTGITTLAVGSLLTAGAISIGAPSTGSSDLAPPGSPRLGGGAVQVVEFADFQCPGCAAMAPILAGLAQNDEMTLVYRYFPLDSIHANADRSARAAAAAGLQGAFWQMAERLFTTQAEWEGLAASQADAYFAAAATALGLDAEQWQSDYASAQVSSIVEADRQAAAELGLSSTPTIYVAGRLYDGPLSLAGIRAALALAASPS